MAFSDYLEDKVLDHVFGGNAFTAPSTLYVTFTVAPSDTGGGTEVSGGAYTGKLLLLMYLVQILPKRMLLL